MSLSRSEISLLTAGPLFRGVSEELLQALAGAEGASLVRFDPGVVYSPRHFRRSLGVVLSGQLQVTKGSLAVSTLEAGDLFGAAALYSHEPEFASTVTAKGPSRCLMLEQAPAGAFGGDGFWLNTARSGKTICATSPGGSGFCPDGCKPWPSRGWRASWPATCWPMGAAPVPPPSCASGWG